MKRKVSLPVFAGLLALGVNAQNPIVPTGKYMADPSAKQWKSGSTVYVYGSRDENTDHYCSKHYDVLSSDDLLNWTMHKDVFSSVPPKDEVPYSDKMLFAPDCVEKDGKYYLIFSAKDKNDVFHLGVAVSDRPEGPFKAQPDPIRGSYSIDPCVFKDDDGSVYTYFGGLWGGQLQRYKENKAMGKEYLPEGDENALPSRVAKMTDDMLQFAEEPRQVLVIDENGKPLRADDPHRFFEASWMHKVNGKYYFSYSTGDSHLLCYAVGDNPYGPFTYKGVILEPVVGWTTHHSIVEYKGKWYLFHHDCVPSNGVTWLRSVKVMELDMDSDGNIKTMRSE